MTFLPLVFRSPRDNRRGRGRRMAAPVNVGVARYRGRIAGAYVRFGERCFGFRIVARARWIA